MTGESIIAIILVSHLKKVLKTKKNYPKWDRILLGLLFIAIGALFIDISFKSEYYTRWLVYLIFCYVIYLGYKQTEFKPVRTVIFAVIPLLIISIIANSVEIVSPKFYSDIKTYYATGVTFSIIWFFAMMIVNNRQLKAQEKDKLWKEIEEENKKALEKKKMQLEYQVTERTLELTKQKEELQQTLSELKATQSQLIHHEKMASLGELTAGIAHEIQNPLNFVNNFSEVSIELLDEMVEELQNNNTDDVIAIAKDIRQNLSKIAQHGKRADAIVKGMLQHSRSSSGNKEMADINAIAEEYLRLSYHGLRAKDKSFNALMETSFETSVGQINMVTQDVGRVLLNLFNNAFYSVADKKKRVNSDYQPLIKVITQNTTTGIQIIVRDNGMGIPKKVLEKIYQPFFTTKPTGEGTGLGLSMSYDIIIKGHSGTINVDTKEGEYAEFIINLPR